MLKGILTIPGQPGLFKSISEGKNSIIVESLLTGKRSPAFPSSKMTALEDIAIFTTQEDVPLNDVFKNIFEKESGGKAINHKSEIEELREYFEKALPGYDKDRVYISDIKKVIAWYNILQEKGLLNFEEEDKKQEGNNKEEK